MSSLQQAGYEFRARNTIAPQSGGTARRVRKVATNFSPHLVNSNAETVSGAPISIALISPDRRHRDAAAQALAGCAGYEVSEFSSYPVRLDDASEIMDQKFSVVIIDLDGDPKFALELVESISADGPEHASFSRFRWNKR